MYCEFCGGFVPDGSTTCPNCGKMISPTGAPQGQAPANGANTPNVTYQNVYVQKQNENIPGKGEAVASMVLGIVGLVFTFILSGFGLGFIAVICGIIGLILSIISKNKGYEGGMRTAGFVMNIIVIVVAILVVIACAACLGSLSSSLGTTDLILPNIAF